MFPVYVVFKPKAFVSLHDITLRCNEWAIHTFKVWSAFRIRITVCVLFNGLRIILYGFFFQLQIYSRKILKQFFTEKKFHVFITENKTRDQFITHMIRTQNLIVIIKKTHITSVVKSRTRYVFPSYNKFTFYLFYSR